MSILAQRCLREILQLPHEACSTFAELGYSRMGEFLTSQVIGARSAASMLIMRKKLRTKKKHTRQLTGLKKQLLFCTEGRRLCDPLADTTL